MASKAGGIAVLVLFVLAALGSTDSGCDIGNGGDGDDGEFDFDDGASTCDGVVAVETASGNAQVPGNTSLVGEDSASCVMREGGGDDQAVVVLQTALARCNGQSVGVDGDYGPDTSRAVMNVQQQHGIGADGAYGPATLEVMGWPGTGSTGCVSGVSAGSTVVEEAS
ncbi:MAG: peptidoglycan-binding domain-containing protein [Acidimicrobiales bacterium]